MIEVQMDAAPGRMFLRTPFKDKERVKALPGRRWDGEAKVWTVPATPEIAAAIIAEWGSENVRTDDEVAALITAAAARDEAQAHKTADGLAQPRRRRLNSWRHQLQAFHFAISQPAAMLAMAMGTGKSKVAVDLTINRGYSRTLIICPKSVLDVWPAEFEKHAGSTAWACWNDKRGTVAQRADRMTAFLDQELLRGRQAIVIVNYEAAWREVMARAILKANFDQVIVDESHRIKTPSGKASLFLSKLGDRTQHKLCLTGTPMPHSPLDIYAQYRFLDKGIFGTSYALFRARYAIMGGYGGYEVKGYQNQDELRARFERLAYQVTADVLDLPDTMHIARTVELGSKTRRAYDQMEHTFIAEVRGGVVTASNALAKLLRLQQITSGYLPSEDGEQTVQIGTEKFDILRDVLQDIGDEPVVVFARFRHDLDMIRRATEDAEHDYCELSGRRNDLAVWQAGGGQVLGAQIQAGGVGIDLTRARYCVYYSVGYSLGDYEQSLARVHRPGQERPVTYYHLIAGGTVDERVYAALDARKKVVEEIIGQLDNTNNNAYNNAYNVGEKEVK